MVCSRTLSNAPCSGRDSCCSFHVMSRGRCASLLVESARTQLHRFHDQECHVQTTETCLSLKPDRLWPGAVKDYTPAACRSGHGGLLGTRSPLGRPYCASGLPLLTISNRSLSDGPIFSAKVPATLFALTLLTCCAITFTESVPG